MVSGPCTTDSLQGYLSPFTPAQVEKPSSPTVPPATFRRSSSSPSLNAPKQIRGPSRRTLKRSGNVDGLWVTVNASRTLSASVPPISSTTPSPAPSPPPSPDSAFLIWTSTLSLTWSSRPPSSSHALFPSPEKKADGRLAPDAVASKQASLDSVAP